MTKYSKETRRMVGRVLQSSAQSMFTWHSILGIMTLVVASMLFISFFQPEKTSELGYLALTLPIMGVFMLSVSGFSFVRAFKSFKDVQEYSVAI